MNITTVFKEESGVWSMRRLLAFLFGLAGIGCGIAAIVLKCVWQIVACAFGVPGLIAIILLFFTTWTDVSTVVSAVKGK